ncbi:hypothetical protein LCGC14_0704020 [marine sediment metagenome]|uniref:Uncharacterized protein n=1 Tax=marine sediment metagenome TaxID=412755 RepID=A0A0F9QH11_9ZZZZ
MERVSFSETDTFGEVNKILNLLIDAHNENEAYNAEVEEYNKSLEKGDK